MNKLSTKPRCGLCGQTKNLMQTACCGNWICDDHHKYVLFSYARNSCARNHDHYTLCAFHHQNGHQGHWKDCKVCRKSFATEIHVWYGTNEYNFEKLANPPHYEPTRCDGCGKVIKLGTDGYSTGPRGTLCDRCTHLDDQYARPEFKPARAAAPRKPKPQLPANPNPEAIEIILSAKVQTRWRVKPAVRATEPPAHWLGQWRVDFAQKANRTWVALVTNAATLYTFVLPLKELKPDSFEKLFRLRLGFALTDAPALVKWKDAPLVFAHGNPRMAIGSMNDMRKHLTWRTETPDWGPMKDDEDWINKTPFLSLPTKFPDKEFASRLAEATVHK
jgi:hypothetical protein